MSTIAKLMVSLGLDAGDYHQGLTASAQATNELSESVTSFGAVALGATVAAGTAVVGLGVAGVKAFAGFQKGMAEVFTLMPGASAESFGAMTQDVKNFSMEFGVLPNEVIPGLYNALSSGVPSDNVFSFLEIAQKAATAGVTDLSVTVDGLTSVINAYGSESITAAQASDQMFAAVVFGKTTFDELSNTLYNVNPIAASLGVSFGDVTSAIAAMTAQGVPTAQTTTMLRQLMVELGDNTTAVGKQFKTLAGVGFKDFITSGGDVQGALQLLEKHALANGIGINELFGSVEAGGAALSLTGKGTDLFNNALLATANSVGATDRAFGTMNQTLDMSFAKIQAAGSVFLITIGEKLAPAVALFSNALVGLLQSQGVATFVENLGNGLVSIITVFSTLALYFQAVITDGDILNDWLSNLPTFIQPAVLAIGTFIAALSSIGSSNNGLAQFAPMIDSTIARFQMMQLVITTVFGAIVTAVNANSDAIASKLNSAWSTVVSTVNSVFTSLNGIIMAVLGQVLVFVQTNGADIATTFIGWTSQVIGIVSTALQLLSGIIAGVYAVILGFTQAHGSDIQTALTGAWAIVKNVISGALTIIGGLLKAALQIFQGDWSGAWATIQSMSVKVVGNIQGIIGGALNIIASLFGTSLAGIVALWQNNWNMLVTITTKIVANVVATLAGLVGQAVTLGANIVKGIINGVSSAGSALVNKLKDLATSALNAAKAVLGISSPSKVFADNVGIPIVMGIIQGLTATWPLVTKWLKGNMAKTVAEFLTSSATLVRGAYNIFKSLKDLQTAPPFQPLIDATDALKTAQDSALGVSHKLLDLNAEIAALTSTPLSEIGDHVAYNQRLTDLYAKQAILLNEQANAQGNLARLGQTQAQAQAASIEQQQMINDIANRARQQYEAAQAQALTMMQTDAKGALEFFNQRKAQIEEMAQLEKDRALATTDEERQSLDTQIRLLQAAQNAESTAQAVTAMIQINPSGQSDQKIIDVIVRALKDAGINVDIRTRTA